MSEPKRASVSYRYTGLNWRFIRLLADLARYCDDRYGSAEQYTNGELVGDRAPLNHIYEHLRAYQCGEMYDHLGGDRAYHLAAVAYNAMMEYFYYTQRGGPPSSDLNWPEEDQVREAQMVDSMPLPDAEPRPWYATAFDRFAKPSV